MPYSSTDGVTYSEHDRNLVITVDPSVPLVQDLMYLTASDGIKSDEVTYGVLVPIDHATIEDLEKEVKERPSGSFRIFRIFGIFGLLGLGRRFKK